MKQKIFCALCVVVMALSCSDGSNNGVLEPKNSSNVGLDDKDKQSKPQAFSKAEDKNSVADFNSVVADTSATTSSDNDDKNVLRSGSPVSPDWDKKIIKTANVTLELKDYKTYNNALHEKLKGFGAYIAQEQQTENDEQIYNDITIKVPVDKFDDLMNSLAGEDVKLLEKNISTEDVTGEVVDTKSRIEAKQQARERYLELLKQAKNMDEILQVQNEINSIQEEIESATGRVNYLVHASAYSTINLKYFQYLNGVTSKDVEPNFFTKVGEAFKTGASVITNLVLFFVSIWPLTIAGIILIIYFKRSRMLSKVQNAQVSDTRKAS